MRGGRLSVGFASLAGLLVAATLPASAGTVTVRAPSEITRGESLVVSVASKRPCALVASQGALRIKAPTSSSRRGKVTFRMSTTGWSAGVWRLSASCGKNRGTATTAVVVDEAPEAPVSGSVEFRESALRVTWADPSPAEDLATYLVHVTWIDTGRVYELTTAAREAVMPASILIAKLGPAVSEVSVTVSSVDRRGQVSPPLMLSGVNAPPPAPKDPAAQRGLYSYEVSWSTPDADDVVATHIYEASSPDGDSRLVSTSTATSATVQTGRDDSRRWVRVAHVDAFGLGSSLAPQEGISVKPRGIGVDVDPPEQRVGIGYAAGVETVTVTWTNPVNEDLNEDLAGVTVRYHRADQPGNYYWQDVPFTFTEPLSSVVVDGLLPNTDYVLQLSTFDRLFNRTAHSDPVTVKTLRRPCFGCPP